MEVAFFANNFASAVQWAGYVTASMRCGKTIDALCLIAVDNIPSVVCDIPLNYGQ
ncbi:hypothetical protein ALQ59_102210 [Pseudomonas syringae pv. apii]|uniref:Uncharacterized protein n=3 Tax=Pseudomonas syringae group genomosp. 3 TaxID=251701 RepID=A0A3M3MEU9_9PSED|nr:hypothetical protein ALO88_102163 [Pseudomonas syringae pv. antirrhini]RMN46102.1 hypothetical protein ALQ59_102210 [Pseudomonas syringae pv. apii]RMR13049.1 hypothetical protein ALP92_102922 [Pseudomonas syringae pv. primulae]RMU92654.1 hypothetical protein ALP19_101872 [Pseudomonas syringae pv. tomato]RMN53110.1 hypothetical protein ALQ58_101923 [Pseudomonas syringae pv. apii]